MNIQHESLADIPLILEFCKRLNVSTLIDKNFDSHGNQKGLSNGQLFCGWLAYILTQNNHCKSPVQEWANNHSLTLEALLGDTITKADFNDCQLSRLLNKFADNDSWHSFESDFYKNSFSILDLNTKAPESFNEIVNAKKIRNRVPEKEITKTLKVDATTTHGHHEIIEDGLMQKGKSKENRSDLPQLKIMATVEGNTGVQIVSDTVPGNNNDDPLYVPAIDRTRKIVDMKGCLICGDCKMSSLNTRADIVEHEEFYLTPLQMIGSNRKLFDDLVDNIVDGKQSARLIYDINEQEDVKLIGAGFEISRDMEHIKAFKNEFTQITKNKKDEIIKWKERVLVIRSKEYADQAIKKYKKKLEEIKKILMELQSKQCKTPEEAKIHLQEKIKKEIQKDDLVMFDYKIEIVEIIKEFKRTEKRNGEKREGIYKTKVYIAKITSAIEKQDLANKKMHKMGWRLYVTNASKDLLKFTEAYKFYRKTMYVVEIGFHVLKKHLDISPLYLTNEKQLLGMTRLLMVALKIMTLMTAEIKSNMKKENVVLEGLYPGQPKRKHSAPTAQSILKYFSRQEIYLTGFEIEGQWKWGVNSLNETCRRILKLLKIPENCYNDIAIMINMNKDIKKINSS